MAQGQLTPEQFAEKLGGTVTPDQPDEISLTIKGKAKPPVVTAADAADPDAFAKKLGGTVDNSDEQETPLQSGLKGAGIRAVPLSARIGEYFPAIGGTV